MPNVRIKNSIANVGIKYSTPNVRASSFQTTRTGDPASVAGSPIGLLLALTYAQTGALGFYGDFRPNVRITTN